MVDFPVSSSAESICGDMRILLPQWADDGLLFDTVITDPPYHLESIVKRFGKTGSVEAQHGKDGAANRLSRGFMEWDGDSGDIAFDPETWRFVLNVLKPGGRLAAFGGPKTFWKLAAAIDAAGFVHEDTISWIYGQGMSFQKRRMKTAWEPILIFRRPTKKVLDLNIDEAKVFVPGEKPRWPANFIHDGSDGVRQALGKAARFFTECCGDADDALPCLLYHAKASPSEKTYRCRICDADVPANAVKDHHCIGDEGETSLRSHPTLKPVSLLTHLVRLLAPADGLVLDPFAGTGTTGVACLHAGRNAICIEKDPVFAAHGRLRMAAVQGTL